jgi:hypothetical protein
MNTTIVEILASVLFVIALLHTFCVHIFRALAERFREGSPGENLFHLLGEVEVVFGLWAGVLVLTLVAMQGAPATVNYINALHFTEPLFVFVIMSVASTTPILRTVGWMLETVAGLLPLPSSVAFFTVALFLGPLLGSFITEPAAMTVIAILLLDRYFTVPQVSNRLKYATLGLLFVNVSIGGTLTHYAAPPVLMVAAPWKWDTAFMLSNFGWRAALACALSTAMTVAFFWKELKAIPVPTAKARLGLPVWVVAIHLVFLGAIVAGAHYPAIFMGLFLFFLGVYQVTGEYQEGMKLKEGMLVGFFLAGLVVLGSFQRWWLEPLLTSLDVTALFWGATGFTAITDNAALTYLGTQVPTLSDAAKIALVSGAVVGGGLTVVANAPNPAGFGILNPAFKGPGISAGGLLLGSLAPTLIAAICFWII